MTQTKISRQLFYLSIGFATTKSRQADSFVLFSLVTANGTSKESKLATGVLKMNNVDIPVAQRAQNKVRKYFLAKVENFFRSPDVVIDKSPALTEVQPEQKNLTGGVE